MSTWSRLAATARGEREATSATDARTPGSIVTIARSTPTGRTPVVGVRGATRVAIGSTSSAASAARTISPAMSSPSGAATAAERPRRLAPTAVIARLGDQRPELGGVAARREDDRARGAGLPQPRRDLEAVDVRKSDVEQDD